jgi:hypothetical protein
MLGHSQHLSDPVVSVSYPLKILEWKVVRGIQVQTNRKKPTINIQVTNFITEQKNNKQIKVHNLQVAPRL